MERRLMVSDGVRIAYDVQPHGRRWLVLLHGAGGDRTAWKHERASWHQRGYATLAVDLRGHGQSDRPSSDRAYQLKRFATDIHELMRAERVHDPILVGHCFGGVVATMAHHLEPAVAAGYVLIDSTDAAPVMLETLADHPWFRSLVGQILAHADLARTHFAHVNFDRYASTGDWNWGRIASDITHTSLASWLATYAAFAQFDGRRLLREITQPVLVIEGGRDSIFPPTVAERIHRELPHGALDLIPNQNHLIVLADAHAIAAAVDQFASALPSRHR